MNNSIKGFGCFLLIIAMFAFSVFFFDKPKNKEMQTVNIRMEMVTGKKEFTIVNIHKGAMLQIRAIQGAYVLEEKYNCLVGSRTKAIKYGVIDFEIINY